MNQAVFSHFLRTYGKLLPYWVGIAGETYKLLVFRAIVPIILAQAVAVAADGGQAADAIGNIMIYLTLAISAVCLSGVTFVYSMRAENRTYASMTMSYYATLTGKDMAFYKDHQTGYLVALFRQYLDGMLQYTRFLRNELLSIVISLVAPVVILLIISWQVGLIALGIVMLQVIYVLWSSRKVAKYRERSHAVYRQVSAEGADDITNIVAFKSAGNRDRSYARMSELVEEERAVFNNRFTISALLDVPRGIATALGTALAFWVIVENGGDSQQAVALMVLTLTYMFQIFRIVENLPQTIINYDDFVSKVYPTLENLRDTHKTISDPENPHHVRKVRGDIELSRVGFSYAKGAVVFSGLSCTIPAGRQVGVVGLSGAGKSTLASLLMRFDDVQDGAILLDGVDIRNVRQDDLRSHIAYVPQEPLLFHRSVRENIAYFRPDASDAEIIRAAKAAHAHEFIHELQDGYSTLVGERGVKLSGGQKQRIVIARAILKDAAIMIFDEATSALDSESEQIIQNALPEILGKRTAIIIAHRLSTVAGLDRIIVMEKGKIIEDGTHQELLQQKGRYHSLWQKQTKQTNA